MILPDDLDEKAEIRVGETDTEGEELDEEEYYRGNGEIKLVLREMKQRPKVKRHRSSRRHPINPNLNHHQHHHQHHQHERIQLGNGLQLSLGRRRRDEDVFILKQEFKGLVQPSSAHNSPRRTPEGSPRKPSPRRHAGAATTAAEETHHHHHHRSWTIRQSSNNSTGLGLNIWPNHSFFSRASSSSQPANTSANTNMKREQEKAETGITDTAIRIEQPSSDVNSVLESPRVRSTLAARDDEVEEDKQGSGSDGDRKKHNDDNDNQTPLSRRRTGGWWWPSWPWTSRQ